MDIAWKGIVGGLMTALVVWLSRRGNTLPGILPLLPTFALIALLIVGAKNDTAGFRETCLAGAMTIPAYLAFLAICTSLSAVSITASHSWAAWSPGLPSL